MQRFRLILPLAIVVLMAACASGSAQTRASTPSSSSAPASSAPPTSSGALVGTEFAAGDTLIFTGTVADCGTGTLVMVSTGRGTTGGKTTSKWEVFEGLGTGDLARVHGTGTTAVAPNSDGTMMATLTGRITCD